MKSRSESKVNIHQSNVKESTYYYLIHMEYMGIVASAKQVVYSERVIL